MAVPSPVPGVAAAYNLWAASYDVDPNKTRDLAAAVLRESSLNLAGRTVIEIGCGTGGNTGWLAESASQLTAVDVSPGMLERARARTTHPNVQFVQHDIRTPWPFADQSADLIVGMLVLEHVEDLSLVMRGAQRVLAAGGELFLCELHPMRQLLGVQAEFTHPDTREPERITAFLHDASEFVGAGLAAGLTLRSLREWRDPGAGQQSPPRILSMVFSKAGDRAG